MAIVLLDESALNEDAGSNYVVKRLIIDVAARDEDHADKLNNSAGAGDHSVFDALSDALKSCGYEMAGDQCIVDGDFSDVYKNNGYEFFTECSMNEDNESDEYKSYKDQWEKNYKGKNKPQKDVDAFIQSAWNDLNNGENRFTGDEFKKLCADAGVDSKKYMKESDDHEPIVVDCGDTVEKELKKFSDDFEYVADTYDDDGSECLTFATHSKKACKTAYNSLVSKYGKDKVTTDNDKDEHYIHIKSSILSEDYDMANPHDAEDIDLALTASLSVKTYEAVEALQRPRFRMKLRESSL